MKCQYCFSKNFNLEDYIMRKKDDTKKKYTKKMVLERPNQEDNSKIIMIKRQY